MCLENIDLMFCMPTKIQRTQLIDNIAPVVLTPLLFTPEDSGSNFSQNTGYNDRTSVRGLLPSFVAISIRMYRSNSLPSLLRRCMISDIKTNDKSRGRYSKTYLLAQWLTSVLLSTPKAPCSLTVIRQNLWLVSLNCARGEAHRNSTQATFKL